MREYHKIDTVFKRDPATKHKTLLLDQYSRPEFEYLANNPWTFTEKVDGTNIRVMINKLRELWFGGKTDNAQIPAFLVDKLRKRFDPQRELLCKMFPDGGCLYGEGYGAKIQKGGGLYRSDQDFVLFDVRVGEWWLERTAVEEVAAKLCLDVVPVLGTGTLAELVDRVRDSFASAWGNFPAEGIVARPTVELRARSGARIITKLKHHDFAQEG